MKGWSECHRLCLGLLVVGWNVKWVRDKGRGLGLIGVKLGSNEMEIGYGWSGLTFDYWVRGLIKIIIIMITITINKMTQDNF